MFLIALFMLLAPGLIAVRILWYKNDIKREDYKFLACDYVIYSFLIKMAVYGFMFITYPERSVSFVTDVRAVSHILSASFVFKYSAAALAAAVILPIFVPCLAKFWLNLEEDKIKRKTKKQRRK